MAHWNVPADVVLMDDAPHLASLGGRCIHDGHTFLWVNQRLPVQFPHGMQDVIILDLDGVVPIYRLAMERAGGKCGTFELALNVFRDRCGFSINNEGFIQLCHPALNSWQSPTSPKRRQATVSTAEENVSKTVTPTAVGQAPLPKPPVPGLLSIADGSVGCNAASLPHTACDAVEHEENSLGAGSSSELPPTPMIYGPDLPLAGDLSDGIVAEAPGIEETDEEKVDKKLMAKSKHHLLTHTPVHPDCEGCMAKTRAKPHVRKAFQKDDPKYVNTITMDQVTIRDEFGIAGVCGYRYGIVMYDIGKGFWSFLPLRTLTAKKTELGLRDFCLTVQAEFSCTLVYCD